MMVFLLRILVDFLVVMKRSEREKAIFLSTQSSSLYSMQLYSDKIVNIRPIDHQRMQIGCRLPDNLTAEQLEL